jgi:hypothetical protein
MSEECLNCGSRDVTVNGDWASCSSCEYAWILSEVDLVEAMKEGFAIRASDLEATISTLRAENLRMREALESIVTHQEIVAGPESSLLSSTARIARSALSVRHHRRGECDCELCEPPRRDV